MKNLFLVALLLLVFLVPTTSMARTNVFLNFGIGIPAPVFVAPSPVVIVPAPPVVVVPPTIIVQPAPVFVPSAPVIIYEGHGYEGYRYEGHGHDEGDNED